jgi:hypothetical protein
MLIVGVILLAVEALEHLLIGESILNPHFLAEEIIYGIGVPALAILLLSSLDRAEEEHSQVEYELGNLNEFMSRLRTSSTWGDLRG